MATDGNSSHVNPNHSPPGLCSLGLPQRSLRRRLRIDPRSAAALDDAGLEQHRVRHGADTPGVAMMLMTRPTRPFLLETAVFCHEFADDLAI